MTVAELRATMSNREWHGWAMYHARRRQARELAEKQAAASTGKGGAG